MPDTKHDAPTEDTIKMRLRRSADEQDTIWTPPPASPRAAAISDALPDGFEAEVIAQIVAPLAAGETANDGHRRKEHAIGAWFDTLTILQARALHARLARPRGGDTLAAAFGRLGHERRERLLAFLAATRRRQAMRAARECNPVTVTVKAWAGTG
jgi:hypothetical protein